MNRKAKDEAIAIVLKEWAPPKFEGDQVQTMLAMSRAGLAMRIINAINDAPEDPAPE